jgi:hypothetical protein
MKKMMFFFFIIGASGCVEGYSHNDLRMLTAYRAKEVCSCLFVQGQSEEFCRAYTVANPNLATYSVNLIDKTVQSEALMMWSNTARYDSEHFGCVLDSIP